MSELRTESGDELARRAAAAMEGRDRAARSLGVEVLEVREGYARCALTVGEPMLNGHDIAHGGYVFGLADTAFAYACNSRNHVNVALNASISFVAPGRAGERLVAVCQERAASKRTGIYDVVVEGPEGRTIALFRGTSYRLEAQVIRERDA